MSSVSKYRLVRLVRLSRPGHYSTVPLGYPYKYSDFKRLRAQIELGNSVALSNTTLTSSSALPALLQMLLW